MCLICGVCFPFGVCFGISGKLSLDGASVFSFKIGFVMLTLAVLSIGIGLSWFVLLRWLSWGIVLCVV